MEGDPISTETSIGGSDILNENKIKTSIFLFIAVFIVFSSAFVEHALQHIPNASAGTAVTDTGFIVQTTLVTLAFIAIDYLVRNEIV